MLMGISGSCFVMIVAQSAATARFYAARHHQRLDENDDLVGLAAANAVAGLSGTFVVNGSPTQTAMVESSGGRSQLAQISTAVVVALVLLFLTKPLQFLPRCVLGSIVFVIAVKLIDLRGLASIRRESPGEFVLAVITAAVVVLVGVEQGIILAMVLSLLRIVKHTYRPHTGVLVARGQAVLATGAAGPRGRHRARPGAVPLRRAVVLCQCRPVRRRDSNDPGRALVSSGALDGGGCRGYYESGLHGGSRGSDLHQELIRTWRDPGIRPGWAIFTGGFRSPSHYRSDRHRSYLSATARCAGGLCQAGESCSAQFNR